MREESGRGISPGREVLSPWVVGIGLAALHRALGNSGSWVARGRVHSPGRCEGAGGGRRMGCLAGQTP